MQDSTRLRRFIRDPLFHFLLAGAAIYLSYAVTNSPDQAELADDKTIIVSSGEIDWLASSWQKRWNRPPTEEELDGLIRQQVRETVLYREALAMGLDKDDVVLRRRLAQKLEFLSQDMLQPDPPAEEELRAYFDENKERYRAPDTITMSHVFFDPDKRGDKTLDDADVVKAELASFEEAPVDAKAFGDAFLLQSYYPQIAQSELAKLFGSGFAEPVFEQEPGNWQGPVLSGYGTHLVYLHEKTVQPEPVFDQVSDAVLADWIDEKREELNERFITALLDRYNVVLETQRAEGETKAGSQ
jgi:peptidyl-prolyl cis-trans isomerase C